LSIKSWENPPQSPTYGNIIIYFETNFDWFPNHLFYPQIITNERRFFKKHYVRGTINIWQANPESKELLELLEINALPMSSLCWCSRFSRFWWVLASIVVAEVPCYLINPSLATGVLSLPEFKKFVITKLLVKSIYRLSITRKTPLQNSGTTTTT